MRTGSRSWLVSAAGIKRATGTGVCTSACIAGCGIAACPIWQTWQCCSSSGLSCQWPTDCAPNTQTHTISAIASRRAAVTLRMRNPTACMLSHIVFRGKANLWIEQRRRKLRDSLNARKGSPLRWVSRLAHRGSLYRCNCSKDFATSSRPSVRSDTETLNMGTFRKSHRDYGNIFGTKLPPWEAFSESFQVEG